MKYLIVLVIIAVALAGYYWYNLEAEDTIVVEETTEEPIQAPEYYQPYSESAVTEALQNQDQAILFFRADWCPTCREAEKDILTNGQLLPENVVIFHADYDTESELKDRYGIVTQHTFVIVNQQQLTAESWVGGGIEELLGRVEQPETEDLVDDQLL